MPDRRKYFISIAAMGFMLVFMTAFTVAGQGQVRIRPALDPRAATAEVNLVTGTVNLKSLGEIMSATDLVPHVTGEAANIVEPATPQIHAPKKVLDFGVLYVDEKWTGTYVIESIGEEELKIKDVKKDCGCTSARVSSKSLPPGATAELEVEYSGSSYPSKVSKKVTIVTNDPATPTTVFKFVGEVTSAFVLEPARFPQFGQVARGSESERSILIKQVIPDPVEITKVESTSPLIAVDLVSVATEPLPMYRLVAKLTVPKDFSERLIKGEIRLHTDFPRQSLLSFNTIAPIEPDMLVNPPFFNFHSIKEGDTPARTVNIHSKNGKSFKILGIEQQPSDFEIEVITVEEGLKYKLVAKMKEGFARKGYFRENVIVKTDKEGYENIPVVLYGSLVPGRASPQPNRPETQSATPGMKPQ